MNCGVIDPTAGPIRIYSPISRNLNDGDKDLSPRPSYLDGAATIISLCALCKSPSKITPDGRCVDAGQVILNLSPPHL